MRLLYVTGGFPWPLTSGYLRHYFLIRELAARHDLTLLSLVGADHMPEHVEALAEVTTGVHTFPTTSRSRSKMRKAGARLRSLTPGARAGDPAHRLGRKAAELLAAERHDAVVFSGKRTGPALAFLGDLPVVTDLCDATSARIRGSLRHLGPVELPAALLDLVQVSRVERRLVERSGHVLFASQRDLEAVLGTGPAPAATVVPNGVDTGYWQRDGASLGTDSVVFTGAMDYAPNEDAARFLIAEVMPLVRQARPAARCSIVGRSPRPALVAAGEAAAGDGVTVTGAVPDVRPHLARASVFVAPLRFGAGIQNKVLDAMAMEVPVVASPLAAEGLRAQDGALPPLQVAEGPVALAERIVVALDAARLDPTPDRRARRYVETHFSWKRSGELIAHVLDDAVAKVSSR